MIAAYRFAPTFFLSVGSLRLSPGGSIAHLASKADLVSTQIASYLLATVAVPARWKTWVGPVALGLGIVLAYLTTLFSIR